MKALLETSAFISGLAILSLEILGLRMFAPYFGFSVFVSGSLIGIVLVSLAIGYYIGGYLADKKPKPYLVFLIILISGLYFALDLLFHKIILGFFSLLDLLTGTLSASLVLLGIPMILLSMVSPYIVKLTSKEKVGLAAGRVSSLATIGAIIGSFLTTFVLIPLWGVSLALSGFTALLLIFSLVVLGLERKKYFVLLAILLILPFGMPQISGSNILFEKDSVYNTIKVIDYSADEKLLILNSEKWVQSIYSSDEETEPLRYFYYFNAGPIISGGRDVLILGMGAGTSASQLLRFFDDVKIDAVEIDPEVVAVSYDYFGVDKNEPRLNIFIEDARRYIQTVDKSYDFIEVDLYHGGPFIPFYTVTQESFILMYDHLKEDGVLMMNVFAHSQSLEGSLLVDHIGFTIETVFPSVYKVDLGPNTLLIATKRETTKKDLLSKLSGNVGLENMETNIKFLLEDFRPLKEVNLPLTDDLSPLEQLTFEMLN